MFQHLHLIPGWFASPQGSRYISALFCLAAVLGMNRRLMAGLGVALSLWLAFG